MVSSIAIKQSQFNISHLFAYSLFYLTHRMQSGATTLGQSGPGSNGNEGVLHISPNLQGWSVAIRWFNDISRPLVGQEVSYPLAEMQSVHFPVSTDWGVGLHVQFESHTDEHAMSSNSGTYEFMSLNWARMQQKQPKIFLVQKLKVQLITVTR